MTASPPPEPGYHVVRTLDLQAAFHTRAPWTLTALQPDGADAETGDKPAKVCLDSPSRHIHDCTDLKVGGETGRAQPLQTILEARVERLSARPERRAVMVTARWTAEMAGGAYTQTSVWSYVPGREDSFLRTSTLGVSETGETERFVSGPLDGFIITAGWTATYADETHWSPHRYRITAYKLDLYGGYQTVLQYLTARTYPAEREAAHAVIDAELPRLRRLLSAAYPKGPPL